MQIESAVRIGLIEAPRELIHAAGNTALRGAKMLLLAAHEPALPAIEHVGLAADPEFQDEFAECMSFPSDVALMRAAAFGPARRRAAKILY